MTKRSEVLLFGKLNGLQIKADRNHIITLFNPKNNFVDCFEDWDECYFFLNEAVLHRNNTGIPYVWDRK